MAMIDDAIETWLAAKSARGSAHTARNYRAAIDRARAALRAEGLDLDGAPREVARVVLAWATQGRGGKPARPATVAKYLATLGSFYAYVLPRGLIEGLTSDPTALIDRAQVEGYAQAKALDQAVVRRGLATLRKEAKAEGLKGRKAQRDLALIRVALTTGRRVGELAALRWRDVTYIAERGEITLSWHAKGNKSPRDTLDPRVAADLLAWLHTAYGADLGTLGHDAGIWLTTSGRGGAGRPLDPQGISEITQRRLGCNPHALRHTFAHGMRATGAPDSVTQQRLGHSSLATTGRYLAQLEKATNPYAGRLADMFDATAD